MNLSKLSLGIFITLILVLLLSACDTCEEVEDCMFSPNSTVTVYRFPDETSDVFGVIGPGDEYKALARTVDGWLGFDPGIAQAGNIGLAHHRWVEDPVSIIPSCIESVELVTMEEIMADYEASTGG